MLFGMVCHGGDWDVPTKLAFAVDLASRKVQLDGFQGLGLGQRVRLPPGSSSSSSAAAAATQTSSPPA